MRSLSLALLLSAGAAIAAPPAHVDAPGLDQVCATQEVDAVTSLEDEAVEKTDDAAELLGETLEEGSARFASFDGVTLHAASTQANKTGQKHVFVPTGSTSVEFGGSSIDLNSGDVVLEDRSTLSIDSTITVTVYDSEGTKVDSLSHTPEKDDWLSLDGVVFFKGDSVGGVAVVHGYGDILIGGMNLEDFND